MEELEELFLMNLSNQEAKMLNPLVLAFIGDTFFSFYVKTKKLNFRTGKVKSLNQQSANLVNAHSQREMLFKIEDILTEEENDIVHRARNANIHSKAKNFSIEEYRHATAFEALVGYLYLTNNLKRLSEIINKSMGEK